NSWTSTVIFTALYSSFFFFDSITLYSASVIKHFTDPSGTFSAKFDIYITRSLLLLIFILLLFYLEAIHSMESPQSILSFLVQIVQLFSQPGHHHRLLLVIPPTLRHEGHDEFLFHIRLISTLVA